MNVIALQLLAEVRRGLLDRIHVLRSGGRPLRQPLVQASENGFDRVHAVGSGMGTRAGITTTKEARVTASKMG